jgi:hypothetical protein
MHQSAKEAQLLAHSTEIHHHLARHDTKIAAFSVIFNIRQIAEYFVEQP